MNTEKRNNAKANSESRKDKNMKTTTTTTESKQNTFANLIREYERQARTRTPQTESEYTKALMNLATAVAYSVLRKCIDVSQNKSLIQVRQEMTKDIAMLNNLIHASNNAYETTYNTNGDSVQAIKDKDCVQALSHIASQTLGDGLDLVNDAVVAIITETEKTNKQGEFMERPYKTRRLKKKVYIKTADSVNGWEDVETTPIQEVYKAVRRSIDSSRAMQSDPRNGYTYIEDLATDTESNSTETIYRRMSKYADIGGYATDYNGKETLYSTDRQTIIDIDELVEQMDLTTKQAKVLQLRQCGYGQKAIATYLGVTKQAIQKTLKQLQAKALEIGLASAE